MAMRLEAATSTSRVAGSCGPTPNTVLGSIKRAPQRTECNAASGCVRKTVGPVADPTADSRSRKLSKSPQRSPIGERCLQEGTCSGCSSFRARTTSGLGAAQLPNRWRFVAHR
jgi:hypothetical protein